MPRYIVLLRAVNLGGVTQVAMARFREILEDLGLTEVRTLLQSGNAVGRADAWTAPALEAAVEKELTQSYGRAAEVFVRSAGEWSAILAANPFPREAETDPARLVLTLLKSPPSAAAWRSLDAAIEGREYARGRGREAYIVYPDGIGRSKLTAQRIERSLGCRGTSRNWNTVRKLAAAASA